MSTRSAWIGAALMILATILLAAMHTLVRHVSHSLHPFEIAFFRNLFGLAAVVPLLVRLGWNGLRSHHPRLQLLRGVLGGVAMLSWFYALSVVPLAEATALSFLFVLFASLGAVIFLSETMRLRRWSAVVCGFVGALFILRPGFQTLSAGMLIVIVSSFAWGMAVVVVKRLSRTDSVVSIVAWMAVTLTILSFPPALWVWTWPTGTQLVWLMVIGTLATMGHLAMVKAFQLGDATALLPLDFTRLLWASVFGYLAFAETPDSWTWVGGSIIVASATYITYRESQLQRKR